MAKSAKKDAPAGEGRIEVSTRQPGGRRRAGIEFSSEPTILDLSDLGADQLAEIEADPLLNAKRVEVKS